MRVERRFKFLTEVILRAKTECSPHSLNSRIVACPAGSRRGEKDVKNQSVSRASAEQWRDLQHGMARPGMTELICVGGQGGSVRSVMVGWSISIACGGFFAFVAASSSAEGTMLGLSDMDASLTPDVSSV